MELLINSLSENKVPDEKWHEMFGIVCSETFQNSSHGFGRMKEASVKAEMEVTIPKCNTLVLRPATSEMCSKNTI